MQLTVDHHFLLNALSFGFLEFHLLENSFLFFCIIRNCGYVWASKQEGLTIELSPDFSTEKLLVSAQ